MTNTPSPSQDGRIGAIDVLRGLALIGIFLVNIILMGGPIDLDRPDPPASFADVDWIVWWVSHLFVYGSMRGLFSILFGASALLFLAPGAREFAFLRRAGWLFVFGAINATLLLWPGDILMTYAMAAPLLLLLRHAGPGRLLAIAVALMAVLSCWSYLEALTSVPAPGGLRADALAFEEQARLGGYIANLIFMTKKAALWMFNIVQLWSLLDALAFMLVGMALLKLGILGGKARTAHYAALLAIALVIGLPLRFAGALEAWSLDGRFPPLAEASFQIARLAVSLGWIGAVMLLWRCLPWRAAFAPLKALGRVALSCYLAQSLIAAFIFSGFGLGFWNQLDWLQLWSLALLIMAVLALFAMLWLKLFARGPAEWLWRRLTFGGRRRGSFNPVWPARSKTCWTEHTRRR